MPAPGKNYRILPSATMSPQEIEKLIAKYEKHDKKYSTYETLLYRNKTLLDEKNKKKEESNKLEKLKEKYELKISEDMRAIREVILAEIQNGAMDTVALIEKDHSNLLNRVFSAETENDLAFLRKIAANIPEEKVSDILKTLEKHSDVHLKSNFIKERIIYLLESSPKKPFDAINNLIWQMDEKTFNHENEKLLRKKMFNFFIENNHVDCLEKLLKMTNYGNFVQLCQPINNKENVFYKAVIAYSQQSGMGILNKLFDTVCSMPFLEPSRDKETRVKRILFGDSSNKDSTALMGNICNAFIVGATQVTDKDVLKSLLELAKTKYNEIDLKYYNVDYDRYFGDNLHEDLFLLAIKENISSIIETDKNVLQIFTPYLSSYLSNALYNQLIKKENNPVVQVSIAMVFEKFIKENDFEGLSVILKECNNQYRQSIDKIIASEYFTKDALSNIAENMAGKIIPILNGDPTIFERFERKELSSSEEETVKALPLNSNDANIYFHIIKNIIKNSDFTQENNAANITNIQLLLKIPEIMKLVEKDEALFKTIKTFPSVEELLDPPRSHRL